MSVSVYEPTGILHSITVDIGNVRNIPSVVKLTQYDNTLPTIAVKLTNGNQTYKIPEAANVSIRVGKPDKTGVYNPCLGVSSDYTTVYFAATEQMCAVDGTLFAIVEVVTTDGTAGTGTFVIKVSENPVNDDTKLSESEIAVFQTIADKAQKAAASISQFETDLSNTMKQSQKAEDTANNALSTANTAKATSDSASKTASDAKQTAETTDARLSSIIADGQQTEGNTELIDIRTGYNGKTYENAGEAVRKQVSSLNEDLVKLKKDVVVDYELFKTYITPWERGFINYLHGEQTSNTSTTQARTKNFVKGLETITCDSAFKFTVNAYQDGTYNNFIGALTKNGEYSKTESSVPYLTGSAILNKDYYYLFTVAYVDDSEFDGYNIQPLYYETQKGTPIVDYVKNLNDTVSQNLDTKVIFDSSFTSRTMIDVYKNANGYYTDYKATEHKLKNTNGLTYYISANGSDENNGLTPDKPFLTLTKALEQSNVLNVICLEGEYTSTNGIVNTDVSNINLVGIGNCIFNYGSAESIQVIGNCYIENIIFKGGWQNIQSRLTDNDTLILYKCKFIDCKGFNSCSFNGGNYYLEDCYCKGSYYDGFNYHNYGESSPRAVEINCRTEITGNESIYSSANGNSCNGSTIHNNGRIIRLNCDYKISHGGVVADKIGMSYNIGCNAEYSTITSEEDDRFKANYWFEDSTIAWLIGCTSSGSKYDISSALGAIVYTDNLYDNNYCDELSQINLIN